MAAGTFTCPRCLRSAPITAGMKFCPHCGLPDAHLASQGGPIDVKVNDRPFRVHDRLAVGSISTIYRCGFWDQGRQIEGVFKIARDARTNPLVDNEAKILRHLHAADDTRRFGPFLPQVVENFDFAGGGAGSDVRRANVLQMDPDIHSPDELYTLGEVRAAYPAGLDGRDVAWIWRRLLNILGFVHEQHIVHGAVLPMHVMIEPRDHKLVLIDWCCAASVSKAGGEPLTIISAGYRDWYKRENALRNVPTPKLDISFGARCMIELLGGDPVTPALPASVDAGLQRHFSRCIDSGGDAAKLLGDFDQLIEALWGPRQFRELPLPPKRG